MNSPKQSVGKHQYAVVCEAKKHNFSERNVEK